jgi:hypothetical protein
MKQKRAKVVTKLTLVMASLVFGLIVLVRSSGKTAEITKLREPGTVETRTGKVVCAAVKVDAQGNTVLTGYFSGTINLGGGPVTSVGGSDIFVAKYSVSQALLWAKYVGGPGDDRATSLTVDPANNVIVTGSFLETVDFGGGQLSAGANGASTAGFLAKYGPDGSYEWVRTFGPRSRLLAK